MKSPLDRGGLRFYVVLIALLGGTLGFGATSPRSILVGLPWLIAGAALHTWAKGCLRQNRAVATSGPYRFVRHPFYLANALIDAGLAVMSGWWPLMAVLPVWWLAIYIPVIRCEERYLADAFPEEYPAYRRRVPCLIPWRRPLPRGGDGFRFSNPNIAGGEELPRVARILAYPLLFFVAQGLRADGLGWLATGWHATAVSGLLALHVLAWELHRRQRQRLAILPRSAHLPIVRVLAAAGFLLAAALVPWLKTTADRALPEIAVVLALYSITIFAPRPVSALSAECMGLLSAIVAGELLWLAPPLIVLYVAWILDRQLDGADAMGPSAQPALWPGLYAPILIGGIAAIVAKFLTRGPF